MSTEKDASATETTRFVRTLVYRKRMIKMGRKSNMQIRLEKARQTHIVNSRVNRLAGVYMAKIEQQLGAGGMPVWADLSRLNNIKNIVGEYQQEKLRLLTEG